MENGFGCVAEPIITISTDVLLIWFWIIDVDGSTLWTIYSVTPAESMEDLVRVFCESQQVDFGHFFTIFVDLKIMKSFGLSKS